MRLVIVSDTHEHHEAVDVPDGDVLIHAGDFTYRGDVPAIRTFGKWFGSLPHPTKIVIAGNHDWAFQRQPDAALAALRQSDQRIVYLQDSAATIDGVRFWGSPWQLWFCDWAFNVHRGPAIAAKWKLVPAETNVLITHGPPMGILDMVNGEHVGCADLLDRIELIRPRVHVFGHIHEGSGVVVQADITYVNGSICDGDYRPVNPPRIVDLALTDK